MSLRLAHPIYESLPYVYMVVGLLAISLVYFDSDSARSQVAFVIGVLAEIAALTLYLRRQDYRALRQEYSGETIEFPSTLRG